jgi:hypothetical protein
MPFSKLGKIEQTSDKSSEPGLIDGSDFETLVAAAEKVDSSQIKLALQ